MNNFFASLKQTGLLQFGMSVTYENDMVSVSILPKTISKDKGLKSLKPLSLRATVDEMDNMFFEAILEPLEQTKEVFSNVESYEASLKSSENKTEGAKKQKEKTSKKWTALQALIKEKDYNPMKDYKKALDMANEILALDPKHKEADKIRNQMSQYEEPQLF